MVDFRCHAELKPIQEDYCEGMLITFFSSLLSFRVIAVAGVTSFSKLQIKAMADKYNGTLVIIFVNLLLDALKAVKNNYDRNKIFLTQIY